MTKEYLNKDIASKRSGRSVRRLLELAAAGRIRKKIITDPKKGNRQLAVFHAADIAALAKGDLPAAAPASTELQISRPLRPVAALPQPSFEGIRPWITIFEAERYTGLPESFLVRLIGEGKLPALDVGVRAGGRWRVSTRDLDAISATVVNDCNEYKAKVASGRA